MVRHQLIALTKAKPGHEAEFEAWYDTRHIPDILRVPGVLDARRVRVQRVTSPSGQAPAWMSMAIYEIEGEDPEPVLAEIKRRARTADMPLSEALDEAWTWQILAGPIVS